MSKLRRQIDVKTSMSIRHRINGFYSTSKFWLVCWDRPDCFLDLLLVILIVVIAISRALFTDLAFEWWAGVYYRPATNTCLIWVFSSMFCILPICGIFSVLCKFRKLQSSLFIPKLRKLIFKLHSTSLDIQSEILQDYAEICQDHADISVQWHINTLVLFINMTNVHSQFT